LTGTQKRGKNQGNAFEDRNPRQARPDLLEEVAQNTTVGFQGGPERVHRGEKESTLKKRREKDRDLEKGKSAARRET